jgi:Flp pilus assembly protein TadG
MMRRLFNLARDRKGAAVIELALAAPILAMMVIGVTDISIAYGQKLELEQAAQRAIEKVAQTTGETTPEDTIQKEAMCQYNGTEPDAEGICPGAVTTEDVSVDYSLQCNGVVTDYGLDCAPGQTEIRYISTTVRDNYTPMFDLHFNTREDGTYHLEGTAGVRVH